MSHHSRIFSGNRALGYVSNHVPLVTRYIQRRKENLIVTCVGRAFHTYGCAHFTLLSVSKSHAGDITCMSADAYHVYTASENVIYAWRRGCELKHTYQGHECPVHLLLPFGPHLISIDEDSNLNLWDIKSEEIVLELKFANNIFKVTAIMHPNTYMNKILLGSEQGHLQIWNLKTAKMIYTFKGWGSPVNVLEQAPAVDVIAVGLASGKIIIHNLKYDETVMEFTQVSGAVTSIAFRSDGHPIMATGSLAGHIVFWNLEEKRVDCQLQNAHFDSVSGLRSLPNEPLMVTSSPDNSLKLWIFDLADGGARLLRIREGHSEPPTFIRFHGSNGHNILSAGGDSSLRIFSTITETFNKSLGRASYNREASKKKSKAVRDPLIMPPITEFTSESAREKEWDNIAATHLGIGIVTTWSYDKIKMGRHKLLPGRFQKSYAKATSVCITRCGHFVIIGYSSGHVDRFNIQSGIHRATYGGKKGGHEATVSGVAVDSLNQMVITAGRDALIKFWPFKPSKDSSPQTVIETQEPVEWLRSHAETSLIALALEDLSIILIDLDTRRLVRHFHGHTSRLTDATFSPDARWLVTASMDRTIRTWDIPSAQPIDIFSVEEACLSLNFSPRGEFLATSHVCNLGIYLWSNRTLYSHVSLSSLSSNASTPVIGLPGSVPEPAQTSVECQDQDNNAEDEEFVSPEQIDAKLITMSSLANSRWQNLLNIDIVKKRNKPKEAPKAPEAAPFFLPTIPSLEVRFNLGEETTDKDDASRLSVPTNFDSLTLFGKLLQLSSETNDFSEVIEKLKSLGPSAIDFEIQSLSLHSGGSVLLMLQFLKMIRSMMKSRMNFELAQAYLGAFLKSHGEEIAQQQQLRDYLPKVQKTQLDSWSMLRDKLFYNLSVVQHLKRV